MWLSFIPLFDVISSTCLSDSGLSPGLEVIGLILVKEWMVEDLYLTALTVIKYYSGQERWILRNIPERLKRVRNVRPSIQRNAVCVFPLMRLDWSGIDRAATRITFLLKPSRLCSRKCFCNRSINLHYLHQSSVRIWTPLCMKQRSGVSLPPPHHLPLFPAQFPEM